MKLITRLTSSFVEIKVDEIETTIFKTDKEEMDRIIYNLLDVVNDLARYTDKSVTEYVNDWKF